MRSKDSGRGEGICRRIGISVFAITTIESILGREVYTDIHIEFRSPHVCQVLTEFIAAIMNIASASERVSNAPSGIVVLFYPLDHIPESFARI